MKLAVFNKQTKHYFSHTSVDIIMLPPAEDVADENSGQEDT